MDKSYRWISNTKSPSFDGPITARPSFRRQTETKLEFRRKLLRGCAPQMTACAQGNAWISLKNGISEAKANEGHVAWWCLWLIHANVKSNVINHHQPYGLMVSSSPNYLRLSCRPRIVVRPNIALHITKLSTCRDEMQGDAVNKSEIRECHTCGLYHAILYYTILY